MISDLRLRSEAFLKFEGYSCSDNSFIFGLVANGNLICSSQTAGQMKELHLKYEITLEWIEIFAVKCDLSCGNVQYSYPFKHLKTVCLPFVICLSSIRDRWDAVRVDLAICTEKFLVVQMAAAIHLKKSSSI